MENTKKRVCICVTNDLQGDQRVQKIAKTLRSNNFEILKVGRFLSQPSADKNTLLFNCFFSTGVAFYLEYNLRLFFYLRKLNVDIVHACDTDTLLAAGMAKRFNKYKLVYDSHEYFSETPELNGKSLKKKIWSTIENRYAPKADLRLTVAPMLGEILSKKTSSTFEIVRNVPSRIRYDDMRIDHPNKILLYQGALNEGRGIETIIDAMPILSDYILWIAGRGDIVRLLKRRAKNSKAKNRIKFLGMLKGDELKRTTSRARYGLNLLEANSLNYEYSLANKFFDYAAYQVPSINMDFPEYRSLIDKYECGILLSKLDPVELAESIKKCDRDASFYIEMQKQSIRLIKENNWELEEKKLVSFYDNL